MKTQAQIINDGMKNKTLIDEHIYVPAKMLWVVVVSAISVLLVVIGGIVWITNLYGDVQTLKLDDTSHTTSLRDLQVRQTQVEIAQSNTNLRLGNIESILTDVAKDVKTLTEQLYKGAR